MLLSPRHKFQNLIISSEKLFSLRKHSKVYNQFISIEAFTGAVLSTQLITSPESLAPGSRALEKHFVLQLPFRVALRFSTWHASWMRIHRHSLRFKDQLEQLRSKDISEVKSNVLHSAASSPSLLLPTDNWVVLNWIETNFELNSYHAIPCDLVSFSKFCEKPNRILITGRKFVDTKPTIVLNSIVLIAEEALEAVVIATTKRLNFRFENTILLLCMEWNENNLERQLFNLSETMIFSTKILLMNSFWISCVTAVSFIIVKLTFCFFYWAFIDVTQGNVEKWPCCQSAIITAEPRYNELLASILKNGYYNKGSLRPWKFIFGNFKTFGFCRNESKNDMRCQQKIE